MLKGISVLVTLKSMEASRPGPQTHHIISSENSAFNALFDEISSSVFVNRHKAISLTIK